MEIWSKRGHLMRWWIGRESFTIYITHKNRNIEKQTFKNTSAFLVLRRMFMPTRGNHIRLMSGILLRLLQPIKHRLRFVFLGNKLRESTLANHLHAFAFDSWAWLQSDATYVLKNIRWRNYSVFVALCGVGSTLCGPPQPWSPLWGEGVWNYIR